MCLLNPTGLLFIDTAAAPPGAAYLAGVLVIVIGYLVLWHFWNGKNWARRLVLGMSLLSVLNLLAYDPEHALHGIVLMIEAALGAFLLYWLNTRPLRAFFRGEQDRSQAGHHHRFH